MAKIDKILKFLNANNVADFVDDEQKVKIISDVLLGFRIDDESRADWLEMNQESMEIIKYCSSTHGHNKPEKQFPFKKSAQVIYPLLAPAVIQLASRLCQSIVRNDKVVEMAVVGEDEPIQAAPGMNVYPKQIQAERVEKFLNYEFLLESDTWLKDTHKLLHILCSWGTAFRQVYYDPVTKTNCSELISPEDVVINHNLTSLNKARRITIIHRMTKNDIVQQIKAGYFDEDFDVDLLDKGNDEENAQEINPVHKVLCQFTYLDLDDDGYAEPYKVYIHQQLERLLGIFPAYDHDGLHLNVKGELVAITPKIDIVDYHCIDSPDGKFYSIGLNYLLTHQNKSITTILRQLIDAGTLSNTKGGFITNAFKTKETDMQFEMGQFKKLEVNPQVNPQQHIIPLPFSEPSQVLLGLLQLLIQAGEKTGFITDVLTGDMSAQNVPATTMLAMIEQATRAFKPLVQKLYISLKKEIKLWCALHAKHLDQPKYAAFVGGSVKVTAEDFNTNNLEICPVADPTLSTDSQKFAKVQFLFNLLSSQAISATNVPQVLLRIFKDLEYEDPDQLIAPPPDPSKNPEMIAIQQQAQKDQNKHQVDVGKLQIAAQKDQNKHQIEIAKTQIQQLQAQLKASETKLRWLESSQGNQQSQFNSILQAKEVTNDQHATQIKAFEAQTNRIKVNKESDNDGN